MKKGTGVIITMMIVVSIFFTEGDVGSQTRDRAEVAEEDTWRLEDLYESEDRWRASKEKMVKELDNVLQYKGKLTISADSLLSCLNLSSELSKEFTRLYSYASMKSDQDTK